MTPVLFISDIAIFVLKRDVKLLLTYNSPVFKGRDHEWCGPAPLNTAVNTGSVEHKF